MARLTNPNELCVSTAPQKAFLIIVFSLKIALDSMTMSFPVSCDETRKQLPLAALKNPQRKIKNKQRKSLRA